MFVKNLAQLFAKLSFGSTLTIERHQLLWQHLRALSKSSTLNKSIQDEHPRPKLSPAEQVVFEGTVGAEKWLSVNTMNLDNQLPTVEVYKQQFNDILYAELPIVYIKASKNNTIMNVTDIENKVIMYTSCRLEGFKNAKKKTQIAGHATGVAAGQKLLRRGIQTVRIKVRGLGPGRLSSVKGLTVAGVQVVSITDVTPLNELGPRPKKVRRLG